MFSAFRWFQLFSLIKEQLTALEREFSVLLSVGVLTATLLLWQALILQQPRKIINSMRIDFSDQVVVIAGFLTGLLWVLTVYLVMKMQQLSEQLKAANIALEARIIQSQQVEEELRQSEERWQFSPLAVIEWDRDFRVLRWSPASERVFGWTAQEVLGKHPLRDWQFIAENVEAFNSAIALLINGSERRNVSAILNHRSDGSIVHCEWYSSAILNESGNFVSVLSLILDVSDRVSAQQALQQNEAQFRLLFENSMDAILIADDDGNYLQANHAACHLMGYSKEQLLSMNISDLATTGLPRAGDRFQTYIQQGGCEAGEFSFVRADGQQRISEYSACQFAPNMHLSILRDITKRKQVEESLQQLRNYFQAILDNSPMPIYLKDVQGKYLLFNRQCEILNGLTTEQVKGKTDYELFPHEVADALWVNDQQVLAARIPLQFEEVAPFNQVIHTYVSIKFPVYDSAGVPYGVCGISTDITERKQIEAELQASEERFRTSVENMLDCFAIFSSIRNESGCITDFRIEYVNPAACRNNLMTQEQQIGKWLCELLPAHRETELFDEYVKVVETGEPLVKEALTYADVFNQQRLSRAFDIRATKLGDGFVAAWRDVTRRKRAEEEVLKALDRERELNEFKSRIISVISHEYRTPLATIQMSAGLLESYGHKWTEEKKLTHFQRIQTAVTHLSQLVNDVLVTGEIEAGELKFKPVPLDIEKFCRDLVEELQANAGTKHRLTLITQVCGTKACLDERLLRQILTNLLTNALKYSPQGGNINFELTCEQETAIFRIQDEGIGIPVADQEKLFTSFHRATNVGTISGTGLGLSIVKESVALHGGQMTFVSEVGIGTTFIITLPLNK